MNTTNHTPGLWSFDSSDLTGRINIRKSHANGDTRILAYCWKDQNGEANANLIASAPDLLSALEQAYNAIAWHIPGDNLTDEEEQELLDTIRAAIAKAKGEA